MNWSVASSETVDGNPSVTLELKDGPYSRSMWDYSFQALFKVNKFVLLYFLRFFPMSTSIICSTLFPNLLINNPKMLKLTLFLWPLFVGYSGQ